MKVYVSQQKVFYSCFECLLDDPCSSNSPTDDLLSVLRSRALAILTNSSCACAGVAKVRSAQCERRRTSGEAWGFHVGK